MRFVVDECTGPAVSAWLSSQGNDVYCVYSNSPGSDDELVLQQAYDEDRILITCDKDFGDLIFREGRAHHGVILLRLADPSPTNLIKAVEALLNQANVSLVDRFVVVSDAGIRLH